MPKITKPGEVPLFLQMWDIGDARFGTGIPELEDRAMIVPDGNSVPNEVFDTNDTDLSYAAAMWQQILFDMVANKMSVSAAVADANNKITKIWPVVNGVQQPNFMVLGNQNVYFCLSEIPTSRELIRRRCRVNTMSPRLIRVISATSAESR